ncbi:MAG: HAMP domain-containing histidine kinase [Lachnospiraceae bacterium]|jgi:signal transduction histidine kinase|nr:HAMP domain-containing histidine kinase [Lachnospiraceae bacterium]
MFRKLHRQLALFSTLVTGTIFSVLCLICLLFAQNSIRQNNYTSFLKEQSTLTANLQSEQAISHQWLNQMQENHHLIIYLYDNGSPLYYQFLHQAGSAGPEDSLAESARRIARDTYGLDIFQNSSGLSVRHEEFSLEFAGKDYYVSAGTLPRGNGHLGFLILYSLDDETRQITWLRIAVLLADIIALLLLSVFSWLFTGRLIKPLEESQKQQTRFIASASHELRSPLAVILSGTESIEKADTPAQAQRFLELIRSEGQRMQHLISDMLLLASSDSHALRLQTQLLQPDELLLQCYDAYAALARERQLSFRLLLPESDPPDCIWDGQRIRQLLSVLLDNALSYTPSGMGILLFLFYPGHDSSQKSGRDSILFGVANQGASIPPEEKKLIFQRFYRSQHSRTEKEHFGLGLCIAKEIALAHQGEIWAEDLSELSERFASDSGYLDVPDFCKKKSGGSAFLAKLPVRLTDSH